MKHARALMALLLTIVLLPPDTSSGASQELLPDLAMAPLRNVRLEITPAQRRLLRFTAEIVNLGSGPFELSASRTSGEQTMTQVHQRLTGTDGAVRDVAVDTSLYFAGDGHLHWHVRDLELYTLESLSATTPVGISAKGGFCFSDNRPYQPTRTNTPPAPVYLSCGNIEDLNVRMGLSVGWGDIYSANLPDQYIDVTDLPAGIYRLRAVADPKQLFIEQDASNNATTLLLRITQDAVQPLNNAVYLPLVERSGTSAPPSPQLNGVQPSAAFICGWPTVQH